MVNDTERWASKMFIHQRWIQSEADTLMAPAVEPVDPAEPEREWDNGDGPWIGPGKIYGNSQQSIEMMV